MIVQTLYAHITPLRKRWGTKLADRTLPRRSLGIVSSSPHTATAILHDKNGAHFPTYQSELGFFLCCYCSIL